jgi:ribokinase
MAEAPSIVVVGSVNLDIVATIERLPAAGETVTGAGLNRFPGGKGANQALAACRLGARVALVAAVGDDANAGEALALLRADGVDLSACLVHEHAPTGVALIAVAPGGENQIVVAPGANRLLAADAIRMPAAMAMICQLEVPAATLERAAADFDGFVCINLAPAMDVPPELLSRADLLVVNEIEAEFYGGRLFESGPLVAKTLGARGAELYRAGERIATAAAPQVTAVDTTGAGDTFTAALTLALVEGQDEEQALRFACAAGAATTLRPGAQPSLPTRADVEVLLSQMRT